MTLKLQPLPEINHKIDDLIKTIQKYKNEVSSVDLEYAIDTLLCGLPRDMIYVEWFDRSQIKDMADSQLNNEEANDDLVDTCMFDLWDSNDSLMTGDDLYERIADSIREQHYKGDDNDD